MINVVAFGNDRNVSCVKSVLMNLKAYSFLLILLTIFVTGSQLTGNSFAIWDSSFFESPDESWEQLYADHPTVVIPPSQAYRFSSFE